MEIKYAFLFQTKYLLNFPWASKNQLDFIWMYFQHKMPACGLFSINSLENAESASVWLTLYLSPSYLTTHIFATSSLCKLAISWNKANDKARTAIAL